MTRGVLSRAKAIARRGFRLVQDTFFFRLLSAVRGLWRGPRFLAVLLAGSLVCCLLLGGVSAKTMYAPLRPATEWAIGPAIAAILTFVVVVELCAASIMMGVRGVLRLSYDIGRHRIGHLLTLAALAGAVIAMLDLRRGAGAVLGLPPLALLALVAVALAIWFDRTYRRPAYPRFRQFHADVVDARQHVARAAHDG